MLNIFSFTGKNNNNNKDFLPIAIGMETDYHPVALNTNIMLKQRLDYLHENPVRSGLVWKPQYYKSSSAINYYSNQPGLLPVQHLFY